MCVVNEGRDVSILSFGVDTAIISKNRCMANAKEKSLCRHSHPPNVRIEPVGMGTLFVCIISYPVVSIKSYASINCCSSSCTNFGLRIPNAISNSEFSLCTSTQYLHKDLVKI